MPTIELKWGNKLISCGNKILIYGHNVTCGALYLWYVSYNGRIWTFICVTMKLMWKNHFTSLSVQLYLIFQLMLWTRKSNKPCNFHMVHVMLPETDCLHWEKLCLVTHNQKFTLLKQYCSANNEVQMPNTFVQNKYYNWFIQNLRYTTLHSLDFHCKCFTVKNSGNFSWKSEACWQYKT